MTHVTKIIGPPGTGKTTHLINRVQDELASGVAPYEIIYTSFTRAACHEARDRALVKFTQFTDSDFQYFSTIHSICFRLLQLDREHVFSGKKLKEFCDATHYDVSIDSRITEDTDTDLPDMMLNTLADYFELFISWMRNQMMDYQSAFHVFAAQPGIPDGFSSPALITYIRQRNEFKHKEGLFDFTDFIEVCISENLYPRDIKVIIADEYQDSSPLLNRLLDMWSEHAERFYIAGDPYQCIYNFIGADPSIFINHPVDENVKLNQSYRCPVAVHDIARQLVKRFKVRYPDDDFIPFSGQAGFVFRNFTEGINWNQLSGTTFYLHRTHWLLSTAFNTLIRDGIPFGTIRGRQSPIQSSSARIISSLYRLVNFQDVPIKSIGKLMDVLPTKTDKYSLVRIGAKTELKKIIKDKPDTMVSVRHLQQLGFTSDFMQYLNNANFIEPLKIPNDEKSYFRQVISKHGVDALDSQPNIILSTIHGVKGKEADHVIINLQLTRRTYDAYLDSPDAENRLYYVGLTRAKQDITLLEADDDKAFDL